jgi:hypothetical protein
LAHWFRRQTNGGKIAFLISVTLAAFLIGALLVHVIDRPPSDGQSCVGASRGEVDSWVGSKSSEIPEGVSEERVEEEAKAICTEAGVANESQDFGSELLHVAIEASG